MKNNKISSILLHFSPHTTHIIAYFATAVLKTFSFILLITTSSFMQNKMSRSERHLKSPKRKSPPKILLHYHQNFISVFLCRKSHSIWRISLLFLKLQQNYLVSPVGVQLSCFKKCLTIMQILRNSHLLLRMKCYNQRLHHTIWNFLECFFFQK